MSLELLTAIASVGTFVVIAITAIAAIVQLHHLRGSNQIAALNEFREAFDSKEFENGRSALPQLADILKDPVARHELLQTPLPAWMQTLQFPARLFETMGGYVKHGIVRAEIVCDLWSPPIIRMWKQLAPAIVIMRRTRGDSLYENFEMLAALCQRWIASHPSTYPRNLPRIAPPDAWAEADARGELD
jgi:hypothetical protein